MILKIIYPITDLDLRLEEVRNPCRGLNELRSDCPLAFFRQGITTVRTDSGDLLSEPVLCTDMAGPHFAAMLRERAGIPAPCTSTIRQRLQGEG
jgi:hypothetical protein